MVLVWIFIRAVVRPPKQWVRTMGGVKPSELASKGDESVLLSPLPVVQARKQIGGKVRTAAGT
jgi:hypothetical protein